MSILWIVWIPAIWFLWSIAYHAFMCIIDHMNFSLTCWWVSILLLIWRSQRQRDKDWCQEHWHRPENPHFLAFSWSADSQDDLLMITPITSTLQKQGVKDSDIVLKKHVDTYSNNLQKCNQFWCWWGWGSSIFHGHKSVQYPQPNDCLWWTRNELLQMNTHKLLTRH